MIPREAQVLGARGLTLRTWHNAIPIYLRLPAPGDDPPMCSEWLGLMKEQWIQPGGGGLETEKSLVREGPWGSLKG